MPLRIQYNNVTYINIAYINTFRKNRWSGAIQATV